MKRKLIGAAVVLMALGFLAYEQGLIGGARHANPAQPANAAADNQVPPPAVSVAKAEVAAFAETVLVTGSIVPREEIIVAPEVDGLRILDVKADQGDTVKKGDVLAVLVYEQLDAQLAQNEAALARQTASIAQTKSQIAEAEARVTEANAQLERARPLVRDKYLSESVFDQRQATARAAAAQLAAAKSALGAAEAAKGEIEAQRRELLWRRGNTEVRAPADGIVSRRNARIGAIALGNAFGSNEPMFKIIAGGEVELDAEVAETHLVEVKQGQKASVQIAGVADAQGTVRLVSPEVDKTTRLGRVRIFLGARPDIKVGSFARGTIETATAKSLAIPQSAVLFNDDGAIVQVVENGRVSRRQVQVGLSAAGLVEIVKGLNEGELVVAKSGTFLRDGDLVRAILPAPKVSEAQR